MKWFIDFNLQAKKINTSVKRTRNFSFGLSKQKIIFIKYFFILIVKFWTRIQIRISSFFIINSFKIGKKNRNTKIKKFRHGYKFLRMSLSVYIVFCFALKYFLHFVPVNVNYCDL